LLLRIIGVLALKLLIVLLEPRIDSPSTDISNFRHCSLFGSAFVFIFSMALSSRSMSIDPNNKANRRMPSEYFMNISSVSYRGYLLGTELLISYSGWSSAMYLKLPLLAMLNCGLRIFFASLSGVTHSLSLISGRTSSEGLLCYVVVQNMQFWPNRLYCIV
jgi:hypothetical protein